MTAINALKTHQFKPINLIISMRKRIYLTYICTLKMYVHTDAYAHINTFSHVCKIHFYY